MPRRLSQREAVADSSTSTICVVGYVRRSTDRQEQSIPDQKKAIERYVAERGYRLLQYYEDDAISGTTSIGRKAFQQMIADAGTRHRAWSRIVVYDVKRFGRVDNDEAGYYRHLLRTHGVEVEYSSEGFNGDETDDLLRPVKQWQARQESKDLAKVTIRGLVSKAGRGADVQSTGQGRSNGVGGEWMGGVPPIGYDLRYENDRGEFLFVLRYQRDGSKVMFNDRGERIRTLERGESVNVSKRDRAKLIVGEACRVTVVKSIFRMYTQEQRGIKAIANALNEQKVPTPRGPEWSPIYAGLWRDSTVRAILVNPVYAGDMAWNRRTDARFFCIREGMAVERESAHGARLVPNPEDQWIVTRNAHEAIVDRRTFERAQHVREHRPESIVQRGTPRAQYLEQVATSDALDVASSERGPASRVVGGWTGARARFLLSGLVRCGSCGSRFQGVTRAKVKPRKDGSIVRNFYYGCGGYIAKGRSVCAFGAVPQAKLEETICGAVCRFYERYKADNGRMLLRRAIQEHLGLGAKDLTKARERAAVEQTRLEGIIANLLDSMTPHNRDLVQERLQSLRSQREAARLRCEELDRLVGRDGELAEMAVELESYLEGLEFTFAHGFNDEKRLALRRAIASIEIATGKVTIHLRRLPLLQRGAKEIPEACEVITCAMD